MSARHVLACTDRSHGPAVLAVRAEILLARSKSNSDPFRVLPETGSTILCMVYEIHPGYVRKYVRVSLSSSHGENDVRPRSPRDGYHRYGGYPCQHTRRRSAWRETPFVLASNLASHDVAQKAIRIHIRPSSYAYHITVCTILCEMGSKLEHQSTPDLNYFTCTLGQAAELNTVDQHSWKTINEFIDRQAQENPNRPAVGFPVPLNNKTQQSKWSFEVYSTWRPETSEFPKLTLE